MELHDSQNWPPPLPQTFSSTIATDQHDPPSTARASSVSFESSSFSSTRSNSSFRKPAPHTDLDGHNPRKQSRKIVVINPPSAFHPDIHPPPLIRVQRSLRSHRKELLFNRSRPAVTFQSSFRDENGRFVMQGSSGGYYAGDLLGGLPHGRGQHFIPFPDPDKMHLLYDGEWEYGTKTGVGSVFYTNGEEYRGELRCNKRWGCGWMRYKDGSFYAGDWLRGRRHGVGIRYHQNGNCYYGAFCKDSQDGWGVFFWSSMRRKFEGEWVTNQPYSGYYSEIDNQDYEIIAKRLLKYCPQSIEFLLLERIPEEERKITELQLQQPVWTIFNIISVLRALRAGDNDSQNIFKTQAGRKENLSSTQLKLLKKIFEVIVPMTDNKAQLHVVHLRRLLVLARISPDSHQGEKLLAHLEQKVKGRTTMGFDEFLLYILQYHHP